MKTLTNFYRMLITAAGAVALLVTMDASAADRKLMLSPAEQAEIEQQAAKGLAVARKLVSRDDPADFGLQQREDAAKLQLGRPLEVYYLDRPSLDAYQPGQRATSLVVSADILKYPVLADGAVRFLITLEKGLAGWKLASIGQTNMGKGLTPVIERFGAQRASIMLVEGRQARAAFALVKEENGKERLFYVLDTPWGFNPNVRNNAAELQLQELVPQLRSVMDAFAGAPLPATQGPRTGP